MNLRDLEYLLALADQRNFHRAAEACGVAQPTLSAQIRKLEAELGTPLLERAPRNLILTPAGAAVVARARRILDEVAQLKAEAARHAKTGTGRLHLGVFPTLGPYLLPHVVPDFIRRFPGTDILLTEEKSGVLVRHLVEGRIDAALLALPVEDPHLTGRVLFEEPFHLAVPKDHPLAGAGEIGPEALSTQRLMLLEEGHCLRDQALELCRMSGAEEQDGFRGTSLETLRQMVVAGMGVTLLPALACRMGGDRGGGDLAMLPLRGGRFRRRIGLFWRKSSAHLAVMEETATLIEARAKALIAA